MSQRAWKYAATACRLILGIVFILSGFVKAVDPWGTALKIDEYLVLYGFSGLNSWSMGFAIWMCGAELMMGCMLFFKVRVRLISIFSVLTLSFFTILTFLSATWLPVEDCGCFGDALKLSPWATFAKNLVLLPMAWVVWYRYRADRIFAFRPIEIVLTVIFFLFSMGLGTYCVRHLPLIDFLPYRIGVDLRNERLADDRTDAAGETILICRNRHTGEERRFRLEEPDWQDESQWEWVETLTTGDDAPIRADIGEFALRDASGDVTEEVLAEEGTLHLLCVTAPGRLPERCEKRMAALVKRAAAEGAAVVCVTPDTLPEEGSVQFGDAAPVRCCNIDATTMKTLLRARNGVVTLHDGVIADKRNCRDISR